MAKTTATVTYAVTAVGTQTIASLAAALAAVPLDLNVPRALGLLPQSDTTATVGQTATRTIVLGGFGQDPTGGAAPSATVEPGVNPGPLVEITPSESGEPVNYGGLPTLSISDTGEGSGATAYVSDMGVGSIVILAEGTGYTSPPTVSFVNGQQAPGGTPATATAFLTGTSVSSVVIDSPGSGYTVFPELVFSGGGGSGAKAIAGLKITGITLQAAGSSYSAPVVTVTSLFDDLAPDDGDQVSMLSEWMTAAIEQALHASVSASIPVFS
jgi:hypothetical protein